MELFLNNFFFLISFVPWEAELPQLSLLYLKLEEKSPRDLMYIIIRSILSLFYYFLLYPESLVTTNSKLMGNFTVVGLLVDLIWEDEEKIIEPMII